jgi:hypothetical protein
MSRAPSAAGSAGVWLETSAARCSGDVWPLAAACRILVASLASTQ